MEVLFYHTHVNTFLKNLKLFLTLKNHPQKLHTLAFAWQFQYCPNQPALPRQLKTQIAFSYT